MWRPGTLVVLVSGFDLGRVGECTVLLVVHGERSQVLAVCQTFHVREGFDPAHLRGHAGGERRQLRLDVFQERIGFGRPSPHLADVHLVVARQFEGARPSRS